MGRPIRRRYHHTPWAAVALVLVLAVAGRFGFGCADNTDNKVEVARGQSIPVEGTFGVLRVVDGDTLELENKARVRLLGIDTPEMGYKDRPAEPWAREATAFTRKFIGHRPVQLRLDHERLDPHGRWLAYVYVDGQMLNEALLRAGLAEVFRKARCADSIKRQFYAAESAARQQRRGLWSR
jgi:micrococcal nuclease